MLVSTPPPLQPPVLKEKTHYIFLETLQKSKKIIKVITNYLDGILMEIMILQLQIALHITIHIALHTCRRSPTSAGRHSLILT